MSLLLEPPGPPGRRRTRRWGGARGSGPRRYEKRGRRVALGGGAALAVAGAATIAISLTIGRSGELTGAATQIPANVQTSVPRLASAPTMEGMTASVPLRVEIPALGINAPVMKLGQNANGSVQVPPLYNHNLTGWFDRSVTPGQDGTSIILGHVDNFTGPSVFFYIKTLHPGDVIKIVRADGRTAIFSVDGVQKVAKATFPATTVYGNTQYPGLRLITCGGPFDTATRQYLDNIVVYSHLTDEQG